jgi:CBS domain containing-hemolysin-like protein
MKLRTRDRIIATLFASLLSSPVWAMPEGLEEKIADVMVWVVVIVIPLVAIYLFWKIHVIPEVIAEKNHHPQKLAIQVLCLLSLVFGGLLWPIAWLWAFSKPIAYKMAYGTDKHDDFFLDPDGHHADKPLDLAIVDDELMLLQEKLTVLSKHRELILSKQRKAPTEENNNA